MEHASSPSPDTLGASTGDSVSTFPNTIYADTPRPSVNDNTSTSVISVDDDQQPEFIATHLQATASLLSGKLSPQQKTGVMAALFAMLTAAEGESEDKPVDLTKSPSSSDQDKSLMPLHHGVFFREFSLHEF